MSTPTMEQIMHLAKRRGQNQKAPQAGEVWRARNGTTQRILSRDDISEPIPALHIEDTETGRRDTVCLDGCEAVFGGSSPLDLMEKIESPE